MKKIFIFLLAVCASMSVSAVGRNDGATKADAIDFDWENGVVQNQGTLWYRVDLAPLYEYEAEDLDGLMFVFSNPMDLIPDPVEFNCQITIAAETQQIEATLSASQTYTKVLPGSTIMRMGLKEIFLCLTTSGQIRFSCEIAAPSLAGLYCRTAIELSLAENNNDEEDDDYSYFSQQGGSMFYHIENLFQGVLNENDDLHITFRNEYSSGNKVKYEIVTACPYQGAYRSEEIVLEPGYFGVTPGSEKDVVINFQELGAFYDVWIKCSCEFMCNIHVWHAQPATVPEPDEACLYSTFMGVEDGAYQQSAGTQWYSIETAGLFNEKEDLRLYIKNLGEDIDNISYSLAFTCPVTWEYESKQFELQPGDMDSIVISKWLLESLFDMPDNIYLSCTSNEPCMILTNQMSTSEPVPTTGTDCTNPIKLSALDPNNGHTQESGITWYEIDFEGVSKDATIHLYFKNEENVTNRIGYGFDECESTMHEYFDVAPNEKAAWFPISPKDVTVTSLIIPVSSTGKCRVYLEVEGASTAGSECTNPIKLSALDPNNGHTQESGITWYEIDFAGVPKDATIHLYFKNEENVTNRIGYGFDECESTMHEYFDVASQETATWFPISPETFAVTSFIMPISSTGKCRVYLEVEGASTDPEPKQVTISYTNSVDNGSVDQEEVELHVPEAPEFEGFTFVKWAVVAGDLADGIEIQAVYTANDPQSAPAIYTNPSNPSQKLIRNGNVYILRDNKTYTLTGQEVK